MVVRTEPEYNVIPGDSQNNSTHLVIGVELNRDWMPTSFEGAKIIGWGNADLRGREKERERDGERVQKAASRAGLLARLGCAALIVRCMRFG